MFALCPFPNPNLYAAFKQISMGSAAGGGAGGRPPPPPDFGGKFFNKFRRPPPPILTGFVLNCFNSIINILELRE